MNDRNLIEDEMSNADPFVVAISLPCTKNQFEVQQDHSETSVHEQD